MKQGAGGGNTLGTCPMILTVSRRSLMRLASGVRRCAPCINLSGSALVT